MRASCTDGTSHCTDDPGRAGINSNDSAGPRTGPRPPQRAPDVDSGTLPCATRDPPGRPGRLGPTSRATLHIRVIWCLSPASHPPDRWTAPRSAFKRRGTLAGRSRRLRGIPGRDHHGPVRLGVPAPGIGAVVDGGGHDHGKCAKLLGGACRSRLRLVARAVIISCRAWRCFQAARQRAGPLFRHLPGSGAASSRRSLLWPKYQPVP